MKGGIWSLYHFNREWGSNNPQRKKWGNVEKFGSAVEWLIHMLKVWEGKVVECAVGKDRQGGEGGDNGGKVKSICCLVWSSDGTLEGESESWRKDIEVLQTFVIKCQQSSAFPNPIKLSVKHSKIKSLDRTRHWVI